jgi:hypothetical protein
LENIGGGKKFTPQDCEKKLLEILINTNSANIKVEENSENLTAPPPNSSKILLGWKTKRKFNSNIYNIVLEKNYKKYMKARDPGNSMILK